MLRTLSIGQPGKGPPSLRFSVAAAGLILACLAEPSRATLIQFPLPVEVTSIDPGITTVAVGDRFNISFTIDDSTVDVNSSVGAGTFPGLITAFTMTADPGNTGSWTPSGAFDLGAASNYVTNAFGDNFTFQVRGSGFPDGGPALPFFDLDLNWSWPGDITDSGLGDTFGEQFGGAFDPALTLFRTDSSIRFNVSDLHSADLEQVPEPAILSGLVLLLLGSRRRRVNA